MKSLRRIILIVLLASTLFSKTSFAYAQSTKYREVLTISVTPESYPYAAFSPDGRKIAIWNENMELGIWDSTTGKLLKQLNSPNSHDPMGKLFGAVEWSPNGQYISGSAQITTENHEWIAYVWDVSTGQRTIIPDRTSIDGKRTEDGWRVSILDATWRPKTLSLLLVYVDGTTWLIDFPSGDIHWSIPLYEIPYYCLEFGCNPVWSPDGTKFASSNDSGAIVDGNTGKQLMALVDPAVGRHSGDEWTSDGKYLFDTPNGDGGLGELFVWDTSTGKLMDIPIKSLAKLPFDLHPDGERIAFVNYGKIEPIIANEITVAKWRTGEILAKLSVSYPYGARDVSWSPDGKRLMLTESEGIHIFEETGSR